MITLKNITVEGSCFIGLNVAYLEDIILLFSIDSRIIYLIIVFEQKSIML